MHSALLLVAVLLIPGLLNMIPLAALAAILIFTGYKLAAPALMKAMFKAGWDQFVPFAVTIVAILATDLLKGIGIGIAVGIFYVLRANYRRPYRIEEDPSGDRVRVVLSEHVSFLHKASILVTLRGLSKGAKVEIDGTRSYVVDHDVLEIILGAAQAVGVGIGLGVCSAYRSCERSAAMPVLAGFTVWTTVMAVHGALLYSRSTSPSAMLAPKRPSVAVVPVFGGGRSATTGLGLVGSF